MNERRRKVLETIIITNVFCFFLIISPFVVKHFLNGIFQMEKHNVHDFEEPGENLKHKIEDEDDSEKLLCGFGACTPGWLQGFHNAKCLLLVLGICAFIQVR